jgi:hypothetical protein
MSREAVKAAVLRAFKRPGGFSEAREADSPTRLLPVPPHPPLPPARGEAAAPPRQFKRGGGPGAEAAEDDGPSTSGGVKFAQGSTPQKSLAKQAAARQFKHGNAQFQDEDWETDSQDSHMTGEGPGGEEEIPTSPEKGREFQPGGSLLSCVCRFLSHVSHSLHSLSHPSLPQPSLSHPHLPPTSLSLCPAQTTRPHPRRAPAPRRSPPTTRGAR